MIGFIQIALVVALMLSLPMWRKVAADNHEAHAKPALFVGNMQVFKVHGAVLSLLCFFCMTGFEGSAGIWISSYLVEMRGVSAQNAAWLSSLFFMGTTLGRVVSGFVAMKFKSISMIRMGLGVALCASILILLPLPLPVTIAGFLLLGIGNAPIYPSMMHATPRRFGPGVSQAVMGLQVAAAYTSAICIPPMLGQLSKVLTLQVVPWAIALLILVAIAMNEALQRTLAKGK